MDDQEALAEAEFDQLLSRRRMLGLLGAGAAALSAPLLGSAASAATKATTKKTTKKPATTAPATTRAVAATPAATAAPKDALPTGEILAGISFALSTGFDPMTSSGATPLAANNHIFEALVDLDPATRSAYPALAADMPVSTGLLTWEVKIRPGAKFHNGEAVTADDVVYSFVRVKDPKNASLFDQFITFIDKIEAVNPSTVRFTLKYPFALFARRISVVKIVPKSVASADQKAFDALPIGSGPYKITAAVRGEKMTFQAYEGYNGPRKPLAGSLTWRLLSDNVARSNALESKQVQIIEDVPYLDVSRLAQKSKVETVPSFGQLFMMFNCTRKPFNDKRVRQAFHYATNRDKIIAAALVGNGSNAKSILHPTHPDFIEAANVYTFQPDTARQLLKDAGVDSLSVTLVTTDTGWVRDCAPIIKEGWDSVGIKTTLDIGGSGGQYANKIDPGNFDVMVAPGDPSVFGDDVDLLMRWWFYDFWPSKRYRWDGTAQYAQIVSLLDQAQKEISAGKRLQLWNRAIDILSDEVPLYPIFHRKLPTGWDDNAVKGFKPLPTTGVSMLGVSRA